MKLRQTTVLAIIFALMVSLIAACQSKSNGENNGASTGSPAATTDGQAKVETKEITMWHSFTQPDRAAVIEEMAKQFEQENPGVKITIETFPWATFHTKWTTGLATKALPDISTALVDEALLMAKSGVLSPMDDVINTLGKNNFIERPLNLLSYDGKVIALPYYAHARVLWYRKDLLEAKGIQPPKTWDELLAAVKAVTDSPNVYGLTVPLSKTDYIATSFLYIISESMGSHIMKDDGTVNLTDPNMIKAIQYLVDLYEAGSPPGSINFGGKEELDLFYQGKTAFDISTGFNIDGILKNSPELADKIAAVPTPVLNAGDKQESAFADYISLVRWNNSKYPEVTQKFVEFMYKKENYVKFLHLVPGGMLPTLKDIAESPEFNSHEVIQKYQNDIKAIQQGIEVGYPIGGVQAANPNVNVLKNQGMIEEMLQKIITDHVSIDKIAKETEDKLNKAIAELK